MYLRIESFDCNAVISVVKFFQYVSILGVKLKQKIVAWCYMIT